MKHSPIEPILRSNLLTLARAYAKHQGIKLVTVSRLAHGDGPFFDKIAAGGGASFTARKYDEVMAWFADPANWPADLERPTIINLRQRSPEPKAAAPEPKSRFRRRA